MLTSPLCATPPSPRHQAHQALLAHLVGPRVADLGGDRAHLGGGWAQATGMGRYLQLMGDAPDGA